MRMPAFVIFIAAAVFSAYALVRMYLFFLHMFQQNGYKPKEYRGWLSENRIRQRIPALMLVLAILILGLPIAYILTPDEIFRSEGLLFVVSIVAIATLVAAIVSIFASIGAAAAFTYLEKIYSKKPLVFTARVKRLTVTFFAVCAVIVFLSVFFMPKAVLSLVLVGAVLLLTALSSVLILLCDLINRPAEKAVGRHFINDAKRILEEHKKNGLTVIGITGSYGKTSVKFFLRDMLSVRYFVCATPSSFNTPMGVVRTIRENMKPHDTIFICEMGARNVGDIRELCDIVHPENGIITAVGPQHLQTFGDLSNVKKTKFELFDAVSEKGGIVFLNADDDNVRDEASRHQAAGERVVYYGTKLVEGGYCASDIKADMHGTSFSVTSPSGETASYSMKLIGSYNVINVLGAIACANTFGIPLNELTVPVRRLAPVEHRMCLKSSGQGVTIIDDAYNSNPTGSKAAVETLSMFEDGERILITPGMVELGDRQDELNEKFGVYAAEAKVDHIILVKASGALQMKNCDAIARGAVSAGFDKEKIHYSDDVKEAIAYAYSGIRTDKHKYILLENDLTDSY